MLVLDEIVPFLMKMTTSLSSVALGESKAPQYFASTHPITISSICPPVRRL
jgi:hypothetical protein